MDHLLTMLLTEQAKELQFLVGSPPLMVSGDARYALQGPPITDEDAMELLRTVATSRQIRNLRDRGAVEFVFTVHGRLPFVVQAKLEETSVSFSVS